MNKLWQIKDQDSDDFIENFTIGDDFILDKQILPFDIIASKAHVSMLKKINILNEKEYTILQKGLDKILELFQVGKFHISRHDEDCHTAIENYLVKNYGQVGKKIHTGRSRNDQILTAIRLFLKQANQEIIKEILDNKKIFQKAAKKFKNLEMPGYTHMQRAMPTTVSVWLESFSDTINDIEPFFLNLKNIFDQSPLGSAAGFGINNFKNDREFSAKKMGFSKVQKNPIYCGFSRGFFELLLLQNCEYLTHIFSRFAVDLLLFSTKEFDFLKLPEIFTTGSSIMPQKRNPDVIEILIGKISVFGGKVMEIKNLISKLSTGYHREFQLIKKPLFQGIKEIKEILKMVKLLTQNLAFKKENLKKAMTDDLFLTEKIYQKVANGETFRDAYHAVKKEFFINQ